MVVKVDLSGHKDFGLAQAIICAIRNAGYEAKFSGGAVRDACIGKPVREIHDIDLVGTAPYDVMLELPLNVTKVPTGQQYGTLTFVADDSKVEVTVCRIDFGNVQSSDSRKEVFPTFCYDSETGFIKDAQRRDLTINGLMADADGTVHDYVGGLKDLENGIIKFIYPESPRDDALRLLRAVRLAASLGFALHPSVFDIAEDVVVQRRLSNLSAERVRDELLKTLTVESGNQAAWAMSMLLEFGVLAHWLPELVDMVDVEQNTYHSHDVWGHTLLAVEQSDNDVYSRLFALFHDLGKPETQKFVHEEYGYSFHNHPKASAEKLSQIAARLKLGYLRSGDVALDVAKLQHLIENHMIAFVDSKMSRVLKRLGVPLFGKDMLDLSWKVGRYDFLGRSPVWLENEKIRGADEKLAQVYDKVNKFLISVENPVISTRDLHINGKDVMQHLNIKPGPSVGNYLKSLLHAVQDGLTDNEREELLIDLYWCWKYGTYPSGGSIN